MKDCGAAATGQRKFSTSIKSAERASICAHTISRPSGETAIDQNEAMALSDHCASNYERNAEFGRQYVVPKNDCIQAIRRSSGIVAAPGNTAKHPFNAVQRFKSFLLQNRRTTLNLRRLRLHCESFSGHQ